MNVLSWNDKLLFALLIKYIKGMRMDFRQNSDEPSELVMGLIGPIGCNRKLIADLMKDLALHYNYHLIIIPMSAAMDPYITVPAHNDDQYVRITNLMRAGNELREKTVDNAIFSKLAAIEISRQRKATEKKRIIYLVDSIKRPEEVEELKNIYGGGFYLFAIHASESSRDKYLENLCHISDQNKRKLLIQRDKDENLGHGQATSEAFHLADFFLAEEGNNEKVWNTLQRFFDIIFGHPFKTPTFNEYTMFMAYAASMKSADMSRQVGAVIAMGSEILSTGANECPRPGGGTYWPVYNHKTCAIDDVENGRDYMNGGDHNGREKQEMFDKLMVDIPAELQKTLKKNIDESGLKDITEYGRMVHAEMDAILGCARRGISCKDATLFSTTFPCHNCAKHIIASGIKHVVFIEPYPKSKAMAMHSDALRTKDIPLIEGVSKVLFSPFIGVGPRRYVDLFSLSLSSGEKLRRKKSGTFVNINWARSTARPRLKMFDTSYSKNEEIVGAEAVTMLSKMQKIVIE
jgi:deoxycytidylate deaminase